MTYINDFFWAVQHPRNDFNIIMILKSLLNDAERESRYREEMETVH